MAIGALQCSGAASYALVIYINKKQKRYLTTIHRVTPHFALFPNGHVRPKNQTPRGITNTVREREPCIQNTFTSGIVSVFFFEQRATMVYTLLMNGYCPVYSRRS